MWPNRGSAYKIPLGTVLAGKPELLTVVVMFLEKTHRPVGVAPPSERVVLLPMEEDGGRLGHIVYTSHKYGLYRWRSTFSLSDRTQNNRRVVLPRYQTRTSKGIA